MWVLVHVIVILNQDVNLNFTWTETSQGHLDSRSCHQKKEKLSTWKESRNKQGKNMEITKIPQQDTGPGPLSLAPGRAQCSLPGRKTTSECECESEQQHKNINTSYSTLCTRKKNINCSFRIINVFRKWLCRKNSLLIGNKSQLLISLCQLSTYHRMFHNFQKNYLFM